DGTVLVAYERCLQQLGHTKEAASIHRKLETVRQQTIRLQELLSSDSDQARRDPAVLCEVGQLLTNLDMPSDGAEWYVRALRRDPNSAAAHEGLAEYFKDRDPERAQQHLEKFKQLKEKGKYRPPGTAPR